MPGKSRKRKPTSTNTIVDEQSQQQDSMTLTQGGKFVPRFSKRLKTSDVSDSTPDDSSDGDTKVHPYTTNAPIYILIATGYS